MDDGQGMHGLNASSISEGYNNVLKNLGGRKSDLAHDIDVSAHYIHEKIGQFRLEVILLLADLYTICA